MTREILTLTKKGKAEDEPQKFNRDPKKEILRVQYHRFDHTSTIVCAVTTKKGFTVIGRSEVYSGDFEQGEKRAYAEAMKAIRYLIAFRNVDLNNKLSQGD